jgi:thiol-disulfide isomerase/thioredoxin
MSPRLRTMIVAAIGLLAPTMARPQDAGIALGAIAPGAAVETLDGRRVDLGTYFGDKPVMVEFWATWCPLCRQLEEPLAAARARYAGKVTFISVGVNDNQTPGQQKAYVEARRLGGVFLFDRDGTAVAAYKVPHTSYLVVIGADRKVVYTGVGGEQDVEAALARAMVMPRPMPGDGNP